MKRIILDTQSSRMFYGDEMEQNYDQRGGLCEVGEGNLVVTVNPIDQDYLDYWNKELGFTLPKLLVAGPFDARYSLSDHIVNKPDLQAVIKEFTAGEKARLEFFWIEETERRLSEVLGIAPYCSFDVSIPYSRKILFKEACERINIPTSPWFFSERSEKTLVWAKQMVNNGISILLKVNDGTGGISGGGILKIDTIDQFQNETIKEWQEKKIPFFAEKIVPGFIQEVALHWEITESGEITGVRFFDQLAENFSYTGVSYPSNGIPSKETIKSQLQNKLGPFFIQKGAKGFFCCDIIVNQDGTPFWTDLNPRKGAIRYVWSFVKRLKKNIFSERDQVFFYHNHYRTQKKGMKFSEIKKILSAWLRPSTEKPFVIITNPGVIPYGYVDITGVSPNSREEAKEVFTKASKEVG